MNFLIDSTNSGWVAVQDDLTSLNIRNRILRSEVVLSDLDDCLLPSPAKKLAYHKLRSIEIFDPFFAYWAIRTFFKLIREDGKKFESQCWQEYIEKFLSTEEEVEEAKLKVERMLENGRLRLYPGVKDLYNLLDDKYKICITRNIIGVALIFRDLLKLNQVVGQQFNKEREVERFVKEHPKFRRYFLLGDSAEDEEALGVLINYKNRKSSHIEDIISCYNTESHRRLNYKFDINVGRNYMGLVEMLRE